MTQRTAVEIAAAVRAGDLSPTDTVAQALGRITAYDDRLGAFQVVRGERALAEASQLAARDDLADLPLAGVPIAIKDNVPVSGEPMRDGSLATSDAAPGPRPPGRRTAPGRGRGRGRASPGCPSSASSERPTRRSG